MRALLFLVLSTILAPASAQQAQPFDPFEIARAANLALDLRNGLITQVGTHRLPTGRILAATTGGLVFDLRLHSVRGRGYRVLAQGAGGRYVRHKSGAVRTVRGRVQDLAGSLVAGGLLDDGLYARIRVGRDEYWIQPVPRRLGAAGNEHVLYRATDVTGLRGTCATDELPDALKSRLRAEAPDAPRSTPAAAIQTAELACDADFEYFSDYGSVANVESRINTVINTMNIQYERDIEVTHAITQIIVRTSSSQPYTSTDASTLLNQFRDHWNANHTGVQRDIAHLFTGKEIDGNTIGIAWVGVVCHPTFGYGLAQSDFNGNFGCATDLSAHELGHNWDANHCGCSGWTMNSFITCANQFHPRLSIKEMVRFRGSLDCLDSGGGQDPTSVHVSSIAVSTPGAGGGNKRARAVVTIVDDLGNPIAGATVHGDFTGDIAESGSAVTGSNGQATIDSAGTSRGKVSVQFCVTNVSASLPYVPGNNVEDCDTN